MKIQSVRGMKDLSPTESPLWLHIERQAHKIASLAGYTYVRSPIVEMTNLFKRSIGTDTDIVEKEMYTFEDKGGDSLTLRPEGTAGLVRAAIENSWISSPNTAVKLFYLGPMYRRERPQKGRYRQFHQFGLELLGVDSPCGDAEIISLGWDFLQSLGLKDIQLRLSTLGTLTCRKAYQEKLRTVLKQNLELIPKDFAGRIESNPQRIFDHKDPKVKELIPKLPVLLNHLDSESQKHFEEVQKHLTEMDVPFTIDPHIVRGLDYYGHTAFEYTSNHLGPTQNAVGGGGRYDVLVEQLGGKSTPAVGLAMGIERLVLLIDNLPSDKSVSVYLVIQDTSLTDLALKWSRKLRLSGIKTQMNLSDGSLKSQMKKADKTNSSHVVIFGQQEMTNNQITIKDMNLGDQKLIHLDQLEEYLKTLTIKGEK